MLTITNKNNDTGSREINSRYCFPALMLNLKLEPKPACLTKTRQMSTLVSQFHSQFRVKETKKLSFKGCSEANQVWLL